MCVRVKLAVLTNLRFVIKLCDNNNGNNRKFLGNNGTISKELWNKIIGKILSIIASGLLQT